MRSPAERLARRERVERVLRTAAGLALVVALGVVVWESRRGEPPEERVRSNLSGSPAPALRDSLAALQRAGRVVTWQGEVAPLVAMAEPVREPGDRWRVAAISDAPLLVRDSLGPIDSLDAAGVLTTDAVRGTVRVVAGTTEARVAPADSLSLGRVVVYGRAGWEPRFAIAALEEAGWQVDARLTLGRERDVIQGEIVPRRARHSVVVVFDTASLRRADALLARFVRAGGGLVLAGEAVAADVPALRAMVGARVTQVEPPETRSFEGHDPTHALPLHVLGTRRADAVLVESREGSPSIVARRVGAGRVVQMGYDDTWRWRMEGEGGAVAGHRAFWSRTVGLAAAATASPRDAAGDATSAPRDMARNDPAPNDPAPRAALVHALGPPTDSRIATAREPWQMPRWLGLVMLTLLLAEWASRRSRGAA